MGDSLAGGLVPLAGRAGSGTASSNSTLSGGLVPLGNKSRPSFRRSPLDEDMDNGGGGSRDERDAEREDSPLGAEGAGSEFDPERKSKRSSSGSRRRRERKEKGGGPESSSRRDSAKSKGNSRRRRGSKDSSKDVSRDDPDIFNTNPSPTAINLRDGSRPSSGHSGASAGGRIRGGAAEEDDSYLFMGATAGAKGSNSAERSAKETALDYDSTDSFGLPKARTGKGSKPHVESLRPTHDEGRLQSAEDRVKGSNLVSGVSAKGIAAEASGLRDHEEMPYPVAHGRTQPEIYTRIDRFSGGAGDMPLREGATAVGNAAATAATVAAGVPGHGIDLEDDFDSPDEIGERLEPALPVAVNEEGVMNSLRGGRKEPRDRMLKTADLSIPPAADHDERISIAGSPKTEPSRRRSPSPPSSPRRGRSEDRPTHRAGSAFRPRPGRGLTYSESQEDLKAGGSVPPKAEERGTKGASTRGLDGVCHDGAASATRAGGTSTATAAVAASIPSMESSRSLSLAAAIGGGSNEELSEGNGVRAEVKLGGLAPKSEASAALESTDVTSEGPAGDDRAARIASETKRELTTSGPGIGTKISAQVPRRSALAKADKSRSTPHTPRSRGVTFDDDLVGVDALDILPGSSSDDDENAASGTPPAGESLQPTTALPTKAAEDVTSPAVPANASSRFPYQQAGDTRVVCQGTKGDGVGAGTFGRGGESGHPVPGSRDLAASSAVEKRFSTPMMEGLSPEAARLMEESSSGEDSNPAKTGGTAGDIGSRLGQGGLEFAAGAPSVLGRGPDGGGRDQKGMEIDEAKLDLALGFTPSAMEGGRKTRRALPAGGRRRSRSGESPTKGGDQHTAAERNPAFLLSSSASSSTPETPGMKTKTASPAGTLSGVTSKKTSELQPREDTGDAERITTNDFQGSSSTPPADIGILTDSPVGANRLVELSVASTAATSSKGISVESSSASAAKDGTAKSLGPIGRGSRHEMSKNGGNTSSGGDTPADASSKDENRDVDMKSVDVAVLVSLERQLALLVSEKEASGARTSEGEQRLQRESTVARDAAAAAQARAFGCEEALAEARARIRQLEAEAAEHTFRLAEVESRAASDLKGEQESCLRRISEAATRHQDDLCESDIRHREVLSEVKRLHQEELEDIRKRNAESKTLEALVGQVQASAGAVKLLQAEMMETKNVSEVSREGHMDARERLIKELEQSARRAQQTAEEEVLRLQGTLMAMDQVMSALRGQNAGERERLRQEHLRMEALQGAMVAEVEAVRKNVEEERERLKERSAALDKERREAAALARAESQRLADQRVKLETEREKFAALQVSATLAAEEMAQRHTAQEENLKLARQSLEREASELEARLSCARADLHKADHVRESLDRIRDQDELERRRLKALAAELERAFEEVQTRTDDTDRRRREAEEVQMEALASAKAATKEREAAQMRSIKVEEAARRLEAERTSVAQARAQSATELSTSRRLKGELSRALAAQQRHGTKGTQAAADIVLSSRTMPLGRHGGDDGIDGRGETGADSRIAFDCRVLSGRPAAKHSVADSENANSCERNALPFTGIAAAEATLHAVSCTPPFPGMGLGRELGRLAQRAADIRGFTREQSAFLSSSRAARFGFAAAATGATGVEARPPEIFPEAQPFVVSPGRERSFRGTRFADIGIAVGQHVTEAFEHRVGGQESGGIGVDGFGEALGTGLSGTILEELDKIEEACTQRSAALEEADAFVSTIGHEEGPVVG